MMTKVPVLCFCINEVRVDIPSLQDGVIVDGPTDSMLGVSRKQFCELEGV